MGHKSTHFKTIILEAFQTLLTNNLKNTETMESFFILPSFCTGNLKHKTTVAQNVVAPSLTGSISPATWNTHFYSLISQLSPRGVCSIDDWYGIPSQDGWNPDSDWFEFLLGDSDSQSNYLFLPNVGIVFTLHTWSTAQESNTQIEDCLRFLACVVSANWSFE